MKCRFCGTELDNEFLNLGHTPLANSYLTETQLSDPEITYPLRVMVCGKCLLAQLDYTADPEFIFRDYDYFSSTSPSWVKDARRKADHLVERLGLGPGSFVMEVGSNDGYLLQHFLPHGVDVLGVDPARECAREAQARGVKTAVEFFGRRFAEHAAGKVDLLTTTNTFAHIPDINDSVSGMATVLKPDGVAVNEFPHLLNLVMDCQFDTIYHEHFFYFSLHAVRRIMETHGLQVFDVECLPTHGGSLRVYSQRAGTGGRPVSARVTSVLNDEITAGLNSLRGFLGFQGRVRAVKNGLLDFIVASRKSGRSFTAYGAPAKGNTLLNYCGIDRDMVDFVVDDSPHKQGKFLPGSHIPIVGRERLFRERLDYCLILPWNLEGPIRERNPDYKGRWVVPVPKVTVMG